MWFDSLEFPPNFLDYEYESLMFFFEQTIHSFLFKTSLKMQSGANTFWKEHSYFDTPAPVFHEIFFETQNDAKMDEHTEVWPR